MKAVENMSYSADAPVRLTECSRAPTTLRGAESDILSPTCFAKMQKLKTDLFAVEIPRVGHVPTLAEPEAIRALDNFLAHH